MSQFNAKRARAKRPCPLWVDAFQRDTQHLEADEVGAYMLILMAMWTRESCDFPDDDRRLARCARVSTRLWKSRVGPVIREFFLIEDGALISDRLRREATYVERQVTLQSNRKNAEKSDKPLENNDVDQSADEPRDDPRIHPSQQPNNPTVDDDDSAGARDLTEREQLLLAMGHDQSGVTANGRIVGNRSDMAEAGRWSDDLGLTHSEQIEVIKDVCTRKRDGPPNSFTYFTEAMRRAAGEKSRARLTPSEPKYSNVIPASIPRVRAQLPE